MPKKIEWTESEMKRMFDLRELGCTYEEIGFELGVNRSTIYRMINPEYHKEYYKNNKEKIKSNVKEYNEANKEKKKKYYEANKEVINQQKKDKYHMNKEVINKKRREKYAAKKRLSTRIEYK